MRASPTLNLLLILLTIIKGQLDEQLYAKNTYKTCNKNAKVCYDFEVLIIGLDRPYLFAVEKQHNILYFSFTEDAAEDIFKTASFNLNTKSFNIINGVQNGFAQTVDENTRTVYIGGSNGVYTYNPVTAQVCLLTAINKNIWNVYFKDMLYYTVFPTQELYVYTNYSAQTLNTDLHQGVLEEFKNIKVDNILIDNNHTIFYTNSTGIYSKRKNEPCTVTYRTLTNTGARALTMDNNGGVYVCLQDGVYSIDKQKRCLKKKFYLLNAFGVAFDKYDNVILSDSIRLIKLTKMYVFDEKRTVH